MANNGQGDKNSNNKDLEHLDLKTAGAASATDMTGLIPANPRGKDIDDYEEIHVLGNDILGNKKH